MKKFTVWSLIGIDVSDLHAQSAERPVRLRFLDFILQIMIILLCVISSKKMERGRKS